MARSVEEFRKVGHDTGLLFQSHNDKRHQKTVRGPHGLLNVGNVEATSVTGSTLCLPERQRRRHCMAALSDQKP